MARIIIPTDFSDNAMHAAKYAVGLFGAKGNSYTLLHAFFSGNYGGPTMPDYSAEMMTIAEENLRDFTDKFTRTTGAEGVSHHIAFGPLTLVLKDHARAGMADIIVMGRRGTGGSAFFGSNTTDVIKRSDAPVLAVPEKAAIKPPKRILLADDHGEVRHGDLKMVARVAMLSGAQVLVAHVPMAMTVDDKSWSPGIHEAALKDVDHSFLEAPGIDVIDGLERIARHKHVDMIALLHRHIGVFARIFEPSTAKELALHADLPLLVLEQRAD